MGMVVLDAVHHKGSPVAAFGMHSTKLGQVPWSREAVAP